MQARLQGSVYRCPPGSYALTWLRLVHLLGSRFADRAFLYMIRLRLQNWSTMLDNNLSCFRNCLSFFIQCLKNHKWTQNILKKVFGDGRKEKDKSAVLAIRTAMSRTRTGTTTSSRSTGTSPTTGIRISVPARKFLAKDLSSWKFLLHYEGNPTTCHLGNFD